MSINPQTRTNGPILTANPPRLQITTANQQHPRRCSSCPSHHPPHTFDPAAFDFPYPCQRTWKLFIIHNSCAAIVQNKPAAVVVAENKKKRKWSKKGRLLDGVGGVGGGRHIASSSVVSPEFVWQSSTACLKSISFYDRPILAQLLPTFLRGVFIGFHFQILHLAIYRVLFICTRRILQLNLAGAAPTHLIFSCCGVCLCGGW